ncbi:MAG: hypothetical protein KDI03_22485, partial [Anaerolineae bacterium]|nr:hypothetical protein [Anaerolineae bacterium]
ALTAPVTLGGLVIAGAALVVNWQRTQRARALDGNEHLGIHSQAGTAKHAEASSTSAELVFLALCTGLYWLFTFVWNPDYGGQRDWDLFSLAAIPATLLLARLLPRVLPDRGQLAEAALMLTAVSAVHTSAWIYQNTLPWEWPVK